MIKMRRLTDRRINRAVERCSGMTPNEAFNLLQNSLPMPVGWEKQQENREFKSVRDKTRRSKPKSKARYRHYAERENLINRVVNQLPWPRMSVIGIEDLSDMKRGKQKKRGKQFRKAIAPWTYRRVLDRIGQKAQQNRVRVVAVPPAHTSQTCPNCHTVSKESRRGESFQCVACNCSGDADHFGALEILARTRQILRSVESLGQIEAM